MGKQFQENNNRGGGFQKRGNNQYRQGKGGGRGFDQGPPAFVIPYCTFMHRSQNNFVVKCTDSSRVPKFNRGVYLETKAKLGTVDEILGPISSFFFSVKPAEGVDPSSFKVGQTFYMNPEDLLPMDRFTQKRAPGPKGGKPGGQKFQGKGKPQFHGKGTKPIFKGNNNKPFAKKPFAKNR